MIVCDLDNTVWGGIVGDDGADKIKLGAPDPVGECFHQFQVALKALRSRGVLLAISSKNDEQFALSVIDQHPAMALRTNDFVAWRINWRDKAENLLSLAEELNLGLDSFVFLDDSPQERDQIRRVLPQVYTPDLPTSPSDLAPFVSSLSCFETTSLGKEDLERTEMYHAERSRKVVQDVGGDVETWLRSLDIKVQAAPLRRESLPRAAQLLNKTNQFNLSLRRLDEKTFWDWTEEPSHAAYTFNVSDRFGDLGLTGLASLSFAGSHAEIVDFVMSCRAMGKKVEEALLGYLLEQARMAGASRLTASPVEVLRRRMGDRSGTGRRPAANQPIRSNLGVGIGGVRVMDELIAILDEIRPGQQFSGAENFFDQGILDSLDLTALVAALETRYNVFMDVDEIVADNFRNLTAIKTTLARKGVKL